VNAAACAKLSASHSGFIPLRPGNSLEDAPSSPSDRPPKGAHAASSGLRLSPGATYDGPRNQPGEADHRAVGPRSRRVPGGQLGTAATATPSATSGGASTGRSVSSRPASPAPPTCTSTPVDGRSPPSTSSPPTTDSRSATWSATTTNTMTPRREQQRR
jgi:hypothetical protein